MQNNGIIIKVEDLNDDGMHKIENLGDYGQMSGGTA